MVSLLFGRLTREVLGHDIRISTRMLRLNVDESNYNLARFKRSRTTFGLRANTRLPRY